MHHVCVLLCAPQDALLRDWHKLTPEWRMELKSHLLQHVVQRSSSIGVEGIKPYVRAQVL